MVQRLPPSRPVTQDDRDELLVPLVSGVQELLFAPVNPFNDRPGFVAGPTPSTGLGRAVQGITRLNCRLWAARDKSNYSPRVNQYNGDVCGPYLAQLGEEPTGDFAGLPFKGGQCPAVYLVTTTRKSDLSGTSTATLRVLGPVGGVRNRQIDATNYDWELFCSGIAFGFTGCGPVPNQGPGWKRIGGFNSSNGDVSTTLDSISPCGADNCGNIAPVIQPPGTIVPVTPIIPNINIDLPGVGPINITVDIGPKGFPIIIAPELGINVEVSPEFGGEGDGGGGGGGAPPLDPEIGPPIDNPPGGGGGGNDTGFGEPPEGRVWVGAYVQLLGDLTRFGVIPRDLVGQAALSTVVGNASLNVQGDNGTVLRSTFTQIRSEWSEHIVPVVGLLVSGIRVKVNPALGYRVYPVSVKDPLAEST